MKKDSRLERPVDEEDSWRDAVRVVLVNTRNPLNIGAAARAMSNFGFDRLRVVRPFDAAFREARSAVGAAELLARAEEFSTVAEAVADCTMVVGTTAGRDRELRHELVSLPEAALRMDRQLRSGPIGMLFGSEKRGLSNDDLSHCHWLLRIPTRADHPSMNLGQAVAVTLYELARDRHPVRSTTSGSGSSAHSQNLEMLTSALLTTLGAAEYLDPASAATQNKVRRLVRRLQLSTEDAETLLGMTRQIGWQLGSGSSD